MGGIPNSAEFREMWADGDRVRDIAKYFGCSDSSVSRAAIRHGLPRRLKPRPWSNKVPKTPEPAPPPPPPEPRVAPYHGPWTAAGDGKLMSTGGKYGELCALAAKWGVTISAITARYHRVRP